MLLQKFHCSFIGSRIGHGPRHNPGLRHEIDPLCSCISPSLYALTAPEKNEKYMRG